MGCGWVVAFTLVVSAIPATARNAEASFWVTTFDHTNGGEGGCDYRPGTTGTTSKGRCGECIAYPTSVRSLLGDAYRFNCVGAAVQSFEYNCTAALGCSDCTVVEDEIPKCTDVTRTGGGQTFGVSIKGVSVEDGVCRAHPYPLVDAKFLTVYPTSDCTVDGEDYATVRLFNVSKEGCSPSGYSQLFYDLSIDTDNAVPMFSGGVDCTEATCGTCAVAFSKIEEGICTKVTVDGASKSMKLLDCTLPPKPQQEDEGPVYTAELLAVGVLVMVVGAFFILQSCQRIGSNRMQTMSLNAPEEGVCSTQVCAYDLLAAWWLWPPPNRTAVNVNVYVNICGCVRFPAQNRHY
eukprot:m.34200 g.34200  ORF g.34200 m.34200 type:complete len:348 (+) comp12632_c0_seq3:1751-2794(+)